MELQFRHLAPYFPYGLNLQFVVKGVVERTGKMTNVSHDLEMTHPTKIGLDYYDSEHIWMFKPILRPLSDLIPCDDDEINDYVLIKIINNLPSHCDAYDEWRDSYFDNPIPERIMQAPYELLEYLFESHYDVFNLIPAGLAISYKQAGLD